LGKFVLLNAMAFSGADSTCKGLARISHRNKLGFSTFTKYLYDSEGGDGVDVYVVDTGINVAHSEFEGRASWGKTIPTNDVDEDGNGHGTHCAGTIASRKYGVAKKANVIAVKVLGSNGSGTMSDVVAGVSWAAQSAVQKLAAARAEWAATGKTKHKGSVANMSLGGGKSPALDLAVNRAVDAGLHFAVAAGKSRQLVIKSLSDHNQVTTTRMPASTHLRQLRTPSLSVPPRSAMSVHTSPTMASVWISSLLVCLSTCSEIGR
jgi:cerevisin